MSKLTLKLPRLIQCGDYHEFDEVQSTLRNLVGNNLVKVKEIGMTDSYVGVVYIGKKPSKDQLKELAAKQGISLTDDPEEYNPYLR